MQIIGTMNRYSTKFVNRENGKQATLCTVCNGVPEISVIVGKTPNAKRPVFGTRREAVAFIADCLA